MYVRLERQIILESESEEFAVVRETVIDGASVALGECTVLVLDARKRTTDCCRCVLRLLGCLSRGTAHVFQSKHCGRQ